jgi:hypothetical protein
MFTREQLKQLKAAGVEDAVLIRLLFDDQEAEEAPADPAPVPAQEPAPAPAAAPIETGADKILAAIERLTGAVQASNMRSMDGGQPVRETADDILASLIAPKK